MSRPKIKQITNIAQAEDDEDTCVFYLQYNPEMTSIMLTINAKREMKPEEYIELLADFVDNCTESPENLFVETVDNESVDGLH